MAPSAWVPSWSNEPVYTTPALPNALYAATSFDITEVLRADVGVRYEKYEIDYTVPTLPYLVRYDIIGYRQGVDPGEEGREGDGSERPAPGRGLAQGSVARVAEDATATFERLPPR